MVNVTDIQYPLKTNMCTDIELEKEIYNDSVFIDDQLNLLIIGNDYLIRYMNIKNMSNIVPYSEADY